MKKLLSGIGMVVSRDIKARIRKNMVNPKTNKTGTTLVKSAILINSISYVASDADVRVGTNVKYARIHHEGGTIFPVRAKYLAIPLTKEAAVHPPRYFENTFIAKSCIMHTLNDGTIEALYVLKRSVKIPARPYMFIDENTINTLKELVRIYAIRNIKGAK